MIRTLLVDDEPPARRRLHDLLAPEPDVEVVGECATARDAVIAMRSQQTDLLFLDVRMPGADGFTVADHVGVDAPLIVFVSAYSEHALRAFEVQALDYLMKPFARERLALALDRARRALMPAAVPPPPAPGTALRRLPVDVGRLIRLLDPDEIDCVRAEGNYVRVHAGEHSYLVRDSLAGICARLDPSIFLRVHRSSAVRLDRVREIETLSHGEYVLRLSNGCTVISGRVYRDRVRSALGLAG